MMRVTILGSARTISFQPASTRRGRDCVADEAELSRGLVGKGVKPSPVQNLKADQMEMDGMRVIRQVDERPDLGGIEHRSFRNWIVPVLAVKQHLHRFCDHIVDLAEREQAGLDGRGLRGGG